MAQYGGTPQLLHQVAIAVNITQKSELSVLSSQLFALVLEQVLMSDDTPKQALTSVLSSTSLTLLPQNARELLLFAMNDSLLELWTKFTQVLGQELAATEEPYRALRLQAKILPHVISTGELNAGFLLAELNVQECEVVRNVHDILLSSSTTMTLTGEAAVSASPITTLQVLNAISLSCLLPSELLSHFL